MLFRSLTAKAGLAGAADVEMVPASDSPLLNAASFTDALVSTWFEKVSYIGALGSNDSWLDGWTEFRPQNANY